LRIADCLRSQRTLGLSALRTAVKALAGAWFDEVEPVSIPACRFRTGRGCQRRHGF
jgi:hypothetical protein